MTRTRVWRLMTAVTTTTVLLLTMTAGVAAAQSSDGLEAHLDEAQIAQLQELLGSDGEDAGSLDDVLDQLGLDSVDELTALLQQASAGEQDGPGVEAGEAGDGAVPDAGIGGFVGTADATALEIGVGLPPQLAEGAADLLDGLGIRDPDTGGIRIAVADTQAQLQRAAAGEEVEGLAKALVTNLLLDSSSADSPGACQGGDTVELPPDQDVPVVSITVLGIDCEQNDERAFADAQLAGVRVSLAGLIEAGFPEDVRTGFNQVLDPLNQELLAQLNEQCAGSLGQVLDPLLPGNEACEALELQVNNPMDVDVPLVDVELLGSTSEVTADDDAVAADAQSTLAGVNVLGLACVGGDGTDPLTYRASAHSDGEAADRSTNAPDAQVRLCPNEASILRLITDAEVFQSVDVFEQNITGLADGQLEELFAGLEQLFAAIETSAVTNGEAYGSTEGAGAVSGVTPLTIVAAAPFAAIPGLDEYLGDLEVRVEAMEVEAAVNTETEVQVAEADEPLPVTGGAAGLLGLAAIGGAVALWRRRED